MTTEQKPAAPLGWCIVEIMGHVQLAGYVTEEVRFGEAMCRVDLPEVPERPAIDDWEGPRARPAIPAFTRYYGGKAIYSITPTTEAAARAFAASRRVEPPVRLEPVAPALGPVKDAEVVGGVLADAPCWECGELIRLGSPREGDRYHCPGCAEDNVVARGPEGDWFMREPGGEPERAPAEGQY
jgi:hypothetical protein